MSIHIFELNFYQDQKKRRNKLIPFEISKNQLNRAIDFLVYKYYYVLIKQIHIVLGKFNCSFVCRQCLSSYTSQNVLNEDNERCEQRFLFSFIYSSEVHFYWKKRFHKNPLFCRIYADFDADNEIDISNIGNKTTNFHKQSPVCNGF